MKERNEAKWKEMKQNEAKWNKMKRNEMKERMNETTWNEKKCMIWKEKAGNEGMKEWQIGRKKEWLMMTDERNKAK